MRKTVFVLLVLVSVSVLADAQVRRPGPVIGPIVPWDPSPYPNCDAIPVGHNPAYQAHHAISDSASVYLNFDDAVLQDIAYQYFASGWGGDFIGGYGIYAMIRAAIEHRSQLSRDTRWFIGCVLRDIRLNPETSLSISCGGLGNSCAEEYMGRALAFAAHDGWARNSNQLTRVQDNVNLALDWIWWDDNPGQYSFMGYWYGIGEQRNVLFNHQTESPVYGMLTLGHLNHVRKIYLEAGLSAPDFGYLKTDVEYTLDWIRTKIDPQTYLFKDTGCGHRTDPWGDWCNCADRPERIDGVLCNGGGIERHPHHYPMLSILDHIGVGWWAKWPWSASDFVARNCQQDQGDHNYVFNCLFN